MADSITPKKKNSKRANYSYYNISTDTNLLESAIGHGKLTKLPSLTDTKYTRRPENAMNINSKTNRFAESNSMQTTVATRRLVIRYTKQNTLQWQLLLQYIKEKKTKRKLWSCSPLFSLTLIKFSKDTCPSFRLFPALARCPLSL